MEAVAIVTQILTTIVLTITLVVIVIYTKKTAEMAVATRDMANASQMQQYDQLRPVLIPVGIPDFQEDHPSWLGHSGMDELGYSTQRLSLRNVGPGLAINVVTVLYPSESIVIDETSEARENPHFHWTCWVPIPIVPGETTECSLISGNDSPKSKSLNHQSLSAPPQPTLAEVWRASEPVHAARLTISYQDIYGRKHTSILDYVQRWHGRSMVREDLKKHSGWELVEFASGIPVGLPDILKRS